MRPTVFFRAIPIAAAIAFLPGVAAAMPVAVAAPVHAENVVSGFYRLTVIGKGGAQELQLIVKEGARGLEAVLSGAAENDVVVANLAVDGGTLRGVAQTTLGRAELALDVSSPVVTGSMKIGKTTMKLVGERAF